jgi:hypothetical protein
LPPDGNQRNAGFMLDRYLDNLTSYAETVCDTYLDGSDGSRPISRAGSSGEDGPINENESAPRAISPTLPEPDLKSHDEGKEREAVVARVKALEPRVKATRDEMKKEAARLVAQEAKEAEIEAEIARKRELRRQLKALDDEREKAEVEAYKARERELQRQLEARERESQRQLEALDNKREKDDPSASDQEATHDFLQEAVRAIRWGNKSLRLPKSLDPF